MRRPLPNLPALALAALTLPLLCLVLAMGAAGPAHAHGDTLKVVITGQRDGRVTADVTWENDGDAVEEAVAATVNAVSADGSRTEGPWRLVRDAGRAAGWVTAEALPPGTWKVTVDAGFPSLGHAQNEVAVPAVDPAPSAPAPSAPPSAAPAGPSAPASPASPAAPSSPASPAPAPAGSSGGSGAWWTTAGVAGIALAGAAAGVFLRRSRR
ncbi:hypothetical protein QEZ40_005420 [Streptomyces katrae]|uniref:Gram-positive cocci surface proteins LPxTG domain-containing protein n=1 Tax=Streptomyces katrae TaxID=68223 RepID=A0ABT7GNW8_9ACTN|nr:hypothetical protein [Streptomyces katrae]MDK9495287.1 hypothetical protein [Streptomyces katrae]